MDNYQVLIGLEMHCEISETNTKVFSGARNSYSVTPNENIENFCIAPPVKAFNVPNAVDE